MVYILFILMQVTESSLKIPQKLYAKTTSDIRSANAIYTMAVSVLSIIFFYITSSFTVGANAVTMIYSAIFAVFAVISNILGLFAISRVGLVDVSMFLTSGSIIIPFIFGTIFLHEDISVQKIISAIILLGVILLRYFKERKNEKSDFTGILFCIILFLEAGASAVLTKLYAISPNVGSNESFCFWTNVIMLPYAMIFALKGRKLNDFSDDVKKITPTAYLMIVLSIILSNTHTLLSLYILEDLNITFTTILGTPFKLILTSIISRVIFKEKLTRSILLSIGLSVLAIILTLL